MSFLRRVWDWALSNKLLVLFIILTETFVITTVWMIIDNVSLSSQLEECQENSTSQTQLTLTERPSIKEDLTGFILPTNMRPDAYDLELYPDLTTGLFKGRVTINVTVLEPTNTIKVHSKGLSVNRLEVEGVPSTFLLDSKQELIIVTTTQVFSVGSRYIDIEFAGDMKNKIVGLYTSSYTEEDGSPRAIVTSRFQPTYAKQAFPCFDEPNLKANFKLHPFKPNYPSYIVSFPYASDGQSQRLGSTCVQLILEASTDRCLIFKKGVSHVRLYSNQLITQKYAPGTLIRERHYRKKRKQCHILYTCAKLGWHNCEAACEDATRSTPVYNCHITEVLFVKMSTNLFRCLMRCLTNLLL